MADKPWYQFPRIDNIGSRDPQGPYPKPDSNVQLPGLYPITALNSGRVTAVTTTSFGQTMVTVKLDNPFNSLATHEFYEHMSNATVSVGQHVSGGDLIGHNNPTGAVPLGFGLYSGDSYGFGSAWATLENDIKPGGANLLNPVAILNKAAGGTIPTGTGTNTDTSGASPGTAWLAQSGPESQKIGIFILALVLAGFGTYILFQKQINGAVKTGVKTAAKAAVV